MKTRTAAVAAAIALALVGGGTAYALTTNSQPAPVETTTASEPAPTEAAPVEPAVEATPEPEALPAHITEPGEVCDPHNANDSLCAAFYPDQLVLNMTTPERSREPLASMPADQKIALAHQACDNLAAGSRAHLIETIPRDGDPAVSVDRNNLNIYAAGALAYCNDAARGMEQYPERIFKLIEFYQRLGEEGAKDHFADKIMPTDEEIGN